MGKLFIALSSFVLAVSAFVAGPKGKAPEVSGTNSDLAGLLNEYVGSGKYVKKSKIYFSDAAKLEMSDYLHAGTNRIEMTTWYDESDGGALLMGNYDGTFSTINSGYNTVGGNMHHFYTTAPNTTDPADLFTNIHDDGWNSNDTVNEFYDVLSGLATEVAKGDQEWTYVDGIYTHAVSADLSIDSSGNYTDLTMKRFQYFAAPMLLQTVSVKDKESSKWLTFSSLKVEQKIGYLSIRIYISAGDSGKVTSEVEGEECMLSEAQVYKGHDDVFFVKVNGQNADIGRQNLTGNNYAEFTYVGQPNETVSIRHSLYNVPFKTKDSTTLTLDSYGKYTFYIEKEAHQISWHTPEYGALINGKAAEVNSVSNEDNKAVFMLKLEQNDTLQLFEGNTQLKFYATGEKATYTAANRLVLKAYLNSNNELWEYETILHARGLGGDWTAKDENKLSVSADSNYLWEMKNVSIAAWTKFKVADSSWEFEWNYWGYKLAKEEYWRGTGITNIKGSALDATAYYDGDGNNITVTKQNTYNIYIGTDFYLYFEYAA